MKPETDCMFVVWAKIIIGKAFGISSKILGFRLEIDMEITVCTFKNQDECLRAGSYKSQV